MTTKMFLRNNFYNHSTIIQFYLFRPLANGLRIKHGHFYCKLLQFNHFILPNVKKVLAWQSSLINLELPTRLNLTAWKRKYQRKKRNNFLTQVIFTLLKWEHLKD